MQTIKAEVIDMIQSLPDGSTLDEINYHLYVRSKVVRGLKAIDEGKFVSESVAEKRITEWSKSFGLNQH
jgi:hypothetical protein